MKRNGIRSLSEKIYITPETATEELGLSDVARITHELEQHGFENIHFPLETLRKLYPLCREKDASFTVTIVHREQQSIVTDIELGDTTQQLYGIAMDYGSTTVVQQLVRLTDGEVLFECREINDQRAYGRDILTRIVYGLGGEDKRHDLHMAVVHSIHRGFERIKKATGVDPACCPVMVIAGNTTMIHFLLELDAWTVFSSPYSPVTTDPGFFHGEELELDFSGMVYVMPSASNYIGGDIVSGLLTIDMMHSDDVQVLFDVGTNGELVMGCRSWMVAGAGAAGPALEGDISKYGMVAGAGAIEHVKIDRNEVIRTTIDNAKPLGICGSGIIDLMAQMRLNGWTNIAGRLDPEASDRVIQKETSPGIFENVAVYAWASESGSGEDLYFSQTDIDQYIETKAAAHTMVDCLLDAAGVTEDVISKMYLSGAMCTHSDLESAITIGMFPDLPREKYVGLRNSSLDGARALLLDRSRFEDIRKILDMIYCVQFASMPDFMIRMQASKFLPHTDEHRYPRVFQRLRELGIH